MQGPILVANAVGRFGGTPGLDGEEESNGGGKSVPEYDVSELGDGGGKGGSRGWVRDRKNKLIFLRTWRS